MKRYGPCSAPFLCRLAFWGLLRQVHLIQEQKKKTTHKRACITATHLWRSTYQTNYDRQNRLNEELVVTTPCRYPFDQYSLRASEHSVKRSCSSCTRHPLESYQPLPFEVISLSMWRFAPVFHCIAIWHGLSLAVTDMQMPCLSWFSNYQSRNYEYTFENQPL